jgi:hypothetical protein
MEKSGFFNSSGGDRVYAAADFASYFSDLVSNGIFYRDANNLKVIPASSMHVTVQPGSAWINGYHYQNTTAMDLTLATADGVNPRVDRVVIRWSLPDREIRLAVKTGAASASPTPPDLTRSSDTYELGIADVAVAKGAITVTGDNIADTRLNPSLCGLVNALISAVYE